MAADQDNGAQRPVPKPAPPWVKRWYQEKPSPHSHEQEALDHVRSLIPKAEPYRAWATFEFTAASGRVNECDLLILVPRGLFLVELKGNPGRVVNDGEHWIFHSSSSPTRPLRNPLHLTNLKAKELKNRLHWAANKLQRKLAIPRVEAAVFLSDRGLQSELDEQQRISVFGRNDRVTGLPKIWDDFLGLPPGNETEQQRRARFELARNLPDLMKKIGVRASTAHLRFGDDWELSRRPVDGGQTWEDRLATRNHPIREEGRLRVYLVGEQAEEKFTREVWRAAEREYQVLQGINHRGIAQALQFRDHMGGPAILFRHGAADLRLDTYLARYGRELTLESRLDLVRQLADALRYAHSRSLYHRALAARSVYVTCKSDGSSPVLRIIDWQVAARDFGTTDPHSVGGSSIHAEHVADSAQVYLAPEFNEPYADPVDLDLFGLGAATYLILTGRPPAVDAPDLKQRLRVDGGLRPRAVSDEVPEELDELVYSVTRSMAGERSESVEWFIQGLDAFEENQAAADDDAEVGTDPLTALPGQHVARGWTVERVLGTGATSRALLVRVDTVDAEGQAHTETRVLKVALDEERAARLRDEAEALKVVGGGAVVRLYEGPLHLHGHTALLLESAGEQSLDARLRSDGPLTYHQLSRFGDDLFAALDQLAGHGVRHRDIKPDNLGLFQRADRTWQLKLFDFSLAKASDTDITAGTRGYLDPFLGSHPRRERYDDAAELYAAAVTLHEMASGERPRWGDGMSSAAMLEDEIPRLATELFESALRQGLTEFFERALHRDVDHRFETLQQMRDAWRAMFTTAEATGPVSTPATIEAASGGDASVQEARELAAETAELDTPLGAAGLSPAAESAANALGATTVGELLEIQPYKISKARGTGRRSRKELNLRHRQWRNRLGQQAAAGSVPASASGKDATTESVLPSKMGVEELAALATPEPGGRGARSDVLRLLLGLPGADGVPSPLPPWCTQSEVAAHLDIKQPTVSRHHRSAIAKWAATPELTELRDELVDHVRAVGGVVTSEELAAELRVRRGSLEEERDARCTEALALAVIRAAVEAETWDGNAEDSDPRLAVARRGARVLVAAEPQTGTENAAPAALADYAKALGEAADRLAGADPLPGRSAVLRDLRAVSPPEGMAPLADTRMVALASAASGGALYSPRLELYPRDLDLARALRISQAAAGVQRDVGITVDQLLRRVQSRFPGLELDCPTRPQVENALREAGFQLEYDSADNRFRPPAPSAVESGTTASSTGLYAGGGAARVAVASAAAGRDPWEMLAGQLEESIRKGGFLALTLRGKRLPGTADALTSAYGLFPIALGARFLAEFRELTTQQGASWDAVLTHDARFAADGCMTQGLRTYVRKAWQRTGERLHEQIADAGPRTVVLLHDAGLAARYHDVGGFELITSLQNAARRSGDLPHGLWLLCPGDSSQSAPQLDGRIVEVLGDHERAALRSPLLDRLAEAGAATA
ncbi:serine/threonine protein kinase [Nocardiopsis gilva YIM 90087]|uniref:Serine/threonine protein kinase n=1 Tax=Nocardiopsis gilva YIM 90087 TaxID=1235441 RepID=A0A223S0R1_9ACTN|nr:BREX system serine/threonine kinase PglW [Nocardiopsis gilva]ASU81706.1 serine/threonine protein kinase [Nocardiopsis gilva YIM 90087]